MMGNDMDGAFNCVVHTQLIIILKYYNFPTPLVNILESLNTGRMVKLAFDGKEELPASFNSGVPQGSSQSPILFVIYWAALNAPGPLYTGN